MKTIKKLFFYFIIFSIPLSSCKTYKAKRLDSVEQMDFLKKHVLLVRLNSHENKIKALREISEYGQAEVLREKDKEENQKTIDAFKNNFTFSKVYFFNPSDGHDLKYGKYDELHLFDADKNEITDKSFLSEGYLVATFGYVHQDPLVFETDGDHKLPAGGTGSTEALVIMDKDYVQLSKPFPFRVITTSNSAYKNDAVAELDQNFKAFYQKHRWRMED